MYIFFFTSSDEIQELVLTRPYSRKMLATAIQFDSIDPHVYWNEDILRNNENFRIKQQEISVRGEIHISSDTHIVCALSSSIVKFPKSIAGKWTVFFSFSLSHFHFILLRFN